MKFVRSITRVTQQVGPPVIVGTGTVGVIALGALGATVSARSDSAIVALIAIVLLAVSAITACIYCYGKPEGIAAEDGNVDTRKSTHHVSAYPSAKAVLLVGLLGALVVQMRFKSGTVIAWGDYTPPEGHAWLLSMFHAWQGTGYNLGLPGDSQTQLPWAVIVALVHLAGGSSGVAQQVWYTLLLASVGMSGTAFLLAVGIKRVPAAVGGLVYLFNPYMLTASHALSPVVPEGMVLVPLVLSWAVMAGRNHRNPWWFWLIPLIVAVLLGYAYTTPPVAGVGIVTLLVSPAIVAWLYGRDSFRRCLWRVVLGTGLVVTMSAYWIVPSIIVFSHQVISLHTLANNSWETAENRATLANAFWLNTVPLWHVHVYYLFSGAYSKFPLVVLRYGLAIGAFSALLFVPRLLHSVYLVDRVEARLISLAAVSAVIVILVSTGTNSPGNILFDLLYRLPFGWLLQVPGRFLYLAGFAYAILVAVLGDRLLHVSAGVGYGKWIDSLSFNKLKGFTVFVCIIVAILSPVYPEFTGAVIPTHAVKVKGKEVHYPSDQVKFPAYWLSMAKYLNSRAEKGSVILLPPHEGYLVPRTWYYGNTSFIQNLLNRFVIDPSASAGYENFGSNVVEAPALIAAAVVSGDWSEVSKIMGSLDAHFLLVSGDVVSSGYNRDLTQVYPSSVIERKLDTDSEMRRIYISGPLELFASRSKRSSVIANEFSTNRLVTTRSRVPDLVDLALFPPKTAIVTAPTEKNVSELTQVTAGAPGADGRSSFRLSVPSDRQYSISLISDNALSGTDKLVKLGIHRSMNLGHGAVVNLRPRGSQYLIRGSIPSKNILGGETFSTSNGWKAGNCAISNGSNGILDRIVPGVGPGGNSALLLGSATGSACRALTTSWTSRDGADLFVSVWVRHVSGAAPRICLWEAAIAGCAQMQALPSSRSWVRYQGSVQVAADSSSISVFVYGDSPSLASATGDPISQGRARTVDEYSDLSVRAVLIDHVVVVGVPIHRPFRGKEGLSVSYTTFNSAWGCSAGVTHVVVDGMVNGCLSQRYSDPARPSYSLTRTVELSYGISGFAAGVVLIVVCVNVLWGDRKRGKWEDRELSR